MSGATGVELVTIGNELLLGFSVDTNAGHLARELGAIGIEIVRRTTVGDATAAIGAAVHEALRRTGVVITTGGLGPTDDDLTRDAVAALLGRALHEDPRLVEELQRRWRHRGLPGDLPRSNRRQALVPQGAVLLENQHGTAPGLWIEDGDRLVVMLPGVPREMRGILADELLSRLRARLGAAAERVVRSRTLRTTGIAEAAVAELLADLPPDALELALAYLPGADGVDLRLTARGLAPHDADQALERDASVLRERLGRHVYGEDADDLAAVVCKLCRHRGLRVAVAESCTGGLLGARLTAIPGSSDVFDGGVIAYDNRVKRELLGVDETTLREHGAVSEAVARQMAIGARARFGTGVAMAVTGVAGPGGGTPEKPVGTVWIAADVQGTVRAQRALFGGDRAEIRWRAAQAALDLIRRELSA
jgi:nicotinamide-nucleotide amidase